jgi:hypothetical protein
VNSAELREQQEARNLARHGSRDFPGGAGSWPSFPGDDRGMRGAEPTVVILDEPVIDVVVENGEIFPVWEG